MKKILVLVLAVIIAIPLVGCQQTTNGTKLSGADEQAVLAFSEPKTDNLIAGMKDNNYATFSMDFDKDMLTSMNHDQFNALRKDRDRKLGAYVSREVKEVYKRGSYFIVVYDAMFEKNDSVIMQVVFQVKEPHQISGLWYDQ